MSPQTQQNITKWYGWISMEFYMHKYTRVRNIGFNFKEDPDILNGANKVHS